MNKYDDSSVCVPVVNAYKTINALRLAAIGDAKKEVEKIIACLEALKI